MRRIVIIAAVTVVLIALVVMGALDWSLRAVRQVPDFYAEALEVSPEQLRQEGDQFERRVVMLRNDARHTEQWQAVFTEVQINGFLAVDLAEQYDGALPDGVSEPRVAITPGQLQLGLRYKDDDIDTVMSLATEVYLTEVPNEIGIRLVGMKAGLMPLPLSLIVEKISAAAGSAELPLRWAKDGGRPVALITIPPADDRQVTIETIELREGELFVAGRTETTQQE